VADSLQSLFRVGEVSELHEQVHSTRNCAAAFVTASTGLGYTQPLPKLTLTDLQIVSQRACLFTADGFSEHFRPLHWVTTHFALTYAQLPVVACTHRSTLIGIEQVGICGCLLLRAKEPVACLMLEIFRNAGAGDLLKHFIGAGHHFVRPCSCPISAADKLQLLYVR
jgi:hypothetical protein